LDDNFVHDAAAAAVAGDIANHMDGHALLEAVEHGAARQVRKRSFFVHILH
jgi:hypothetical protein